MNRNKFNNKKLIILFVILFISIGFALLSTNLNIRGLLGFKDSKWDVHFDNIELINNDVESSIPVINETNTSIDFGGTFKEPGDVFEFSVDVVNSGTIDAMLNTVTKTGIDTANENYLNYTVTYDDNLEIKKYDLLKKDCRVRLKIKVEYKYDIENIPNLEQQSFSLSLEYVSSTNDAVDRGNTFKKSDANNVFTIANAKENSLDNLKIYGNSTQTTYEGRNLYNYTDIYNSSAKLDDDGWITLSSNNLEGTTPVYVFHSTNNLNLNPENKYVVILEVKSVSGNCNIHPTSYYNNYGQLEDHHYSFENLANNKTYYYVASVNNGYIGNAGLRTYISVQPGNSGSITFRISVIEGENIDINNFKYEPYVGEKSSPSPEYPQEIKSITGTSHLQISGKNLFDFDDYDYSHQGIKSTYSNNVLHCLGTPTTNWSRLMLAKDFYLNEGTYNISIENKIYDTNNTTNVQFVITLIFDDNTTYKCYFTSLRSFKITKKVKSVILGMDHLNPDLSYDFSVRFQLEEGNTKTDFVTPKRKVYNVNLGLLKLNGIDDYRDYIHNVNDKWYVHKEIEEYTFTGEEHFESLSLGKGDALNKKRFGILDFLMKVINARKQGCLCNFYKGIPYNSGIHSNNIINSTALYDSGKIFAFTTDSETMTLDEFKALITGSKYYYVMNKPKEIEIKDETLIDQLNNILSDNLYEGYNYVVFDSNIETKIDFDYKN